MRQEGRDGDLDVVVASGTADDLDWFENTAGNGSAWTEHQSDGSFDGVACIRAADVDGDGDLDVLASALGTSDDIVWYENTGGDGSAWSKHNIDTNFADPRVVEAADIDGDGDLDVYATGTGFTGAESVYVIDMDTVSMPIYY